MSATDPIQPWRKAGGEPVSGAKLEQMRAQMITDIRVAEPLTLYRLGNSVSIMLPTQPKSKEVCSTDSPATLGDSVGGSLSVDDSTWGRDPDGSETLNGTPLDLWVLVDIIYDAVTGFALHKKFRRLREDACGKLYLVSGENIVSVFTTEECAGDTMGGF